MPTVKAWHARGVRVRGRDGGMKVNWRDTKWARTCMRRNWALMVRDSGVPRPFVYAPEPFITQVVDLLCVRVHKQAGTWYEGGLTFVWDSDGRKVHWLC